MKKIILALLLISLSAPLYAKAHNGTFKLMDYRRGANNTFDSTIEVKYTLDSLMGEPVVKASARYSVMGFVYFDGKQHDLSREQLNKLKIYNLKLTVPFETKAIPKRLFIEIDMGAMGAPGKWSYNTPGSPNWNKWIMDENGFYLSKEKAIKAYKGFQRLGVSSGLGSLAEVKSIKFNVSGAKTKAKAKKSVLKDVWVDKSTRLMWQDEVYSQREIDNYTKYHKKGKSFGKTGSWYHAKEYCQNLKLAGLNDWRMPTINELDGIKDKRNNFKSKKQFRGVWSSSSNSNKKFIYSFVDYDKGDKVKWSKEKSIIEFVRCVRNRG